MRTNSILQLLSDHKVVIPPVQRDYAQGRETEKIRSIRNNFLNAIHRTLSDLSLPALALDFVYGYVTKPSTSHQLPTFIPLDGQQRLTTLFLLHWYIANKENKINSAQERLKRFSYSTRKSARDFCEKLVSFIPIIGIPIDQQIENQPWFFPTWSNDPTIRSMLVVLHDIDEKFSRLPPVWDYLDGNNPRLSFHILPMDDLDLPDDLYIKMNARGKELTDFEHFKSKISEILQGEKSSEFNNNIDKDWSDLFWNIYKNSDSVDIAKQVDEGFLNFTWYITNVLHHRRELAIDSKYLLNTLVDTYKEEQSIDFLFQCLNLFTSLGKTSPDCFDALFYVDPADFIESRCRLFYDRAQRNLFEKCASGYKNDTFVLREQLLLYAFIQIRLQNKVVPEDFYRTTRNLLEYAQDSLVRKENFKLLYELIDKLIADHTIDDSLPFSQRQQKEEQQKRHLISTHPELKKIIYELEDHILLRGNIAILNIDSTIGNYGVHFIKAFNQYSNYARTSKALLTLGNYTQQYRSKFRRFGNSNNSSWREILTQSENRSDFGNTQNVIKQYLDLRSSDSQLTDEQIIEGYLAGFVNDPIRAKDFNYYYIKYDTFSSWKANQTEGYYFWEDIQQRQYECTMLFRSNYRGRHWSPFLLAISDKANCYLDEYGSDLQYTKDNITLMIRNIQSGFQFYAKEAVQQEVIGQLIYNGLLDETGTLTISQNESGVDIEDRIDKCSKLLDRLSVDVMI